uniref:acyl-CoA dehydrogenase family protein n=1 Tax=Nocardia shimofusensis TaxID=228596 RepID=UPI0008324CEC|nr:acyl-CoA dehydrogenase family protein [Nocardia shimofusensis]
MGIELAAEATEFGSQAVRALGAAGGDELVRAAELDPYCRHELVSPVLHRIGAWDLAPRHDPLELEAAAALCRACGYWATPYPVAERLARPVDPVGAVPTGSALSGSGADGLIVVSGPEPAAALAGLDLRFVAVTPNGGRGLVRVRDSARREVLASGRTGAFALRVEFESLGGADGRSNGSPHSVPVGQTGGVGTADGATRDASPDADLALVLTLQCWTLLGMLDRAVELAKDHVLVREQFGKPLAEFQAVQFQLTDAEVERKGVEMLARYAIWSIQSGRSDAVADALALRLAALEAADIVFRVAHQLHGALGFCDESPLSWLSRHSLPLRRLPVGSSGTEEWLTRRIGTRGLTGLFSEPGER